MNYIKEEFLINYEKYQFGYTEWGIPESEHDVVTLYNQGYLPYSGNERPLPCYYLCRSLRVCAGDFVPISENRRIFKKVHEMGIVPEMSEYSGKEALNQVELKSFLINYFTAHHGELVMTLERLESILNYSPYVFVTTYVHQGEYICAVISQKVGSMVHYWFAAYSDHYTHLSLGMWLMLTFIKGYSENTPETMVYLGTGYGPKALYKTNIEQVEYFDGNNWKKDLKTLKNLLKGT